MSSGVAGWAANGDRRKQGLCSCATCLRRPQLGRTRRRHVRGQAASSRGNNRRQLALPHARAAIAAFAVSTQSDIL